MGRCMDDKGIILYNIGITEVIHPFINKQLFFIAQCKSIEGYSWSNYDINFDNIFKGFLYLFILSTGEDWFHIYYKIEFD